MSLVLAKAKPREGSYFFEEQFVALHTPNELLLIENIIEEAAEVEAWILNIKGNSAIACEHMEQNVIKSTVAKFDVNQAKRRQKEYWRKALNRKAIRHIRSKILAFHLENLTLTLAIQQASRHRLICQDLKILKHYYESDVQSCKKKKGCYVSN